MPRRFVLKLKPGRVFLRCYSSSGPGLSWDAFVGFVPRDGDVEIWAAPDLEEDEPEYIRSLPGPMHPRTLAAMLAAGDDDVGFLEGDFLEDAYVEGLSGLWAELLLLAWVHDEDSHTCEVAKALLTLDDAQLATLRDRLGPFTDVDTLQRFASVLSQADEAGLGDVSLAELVSRASPGELDLDVLEGWLSRTVVEGEQRHNQRQSDRDTRLAPHAAEIERMVAVYARTHPNPGGSIAYMGFCMRRSAVRRFIEEHVLAHGAVPEGVHDLGTLPSGPVVGPVDFDTLRRREE